MVLVRCHEKEWTDKKGKPIKSNWKSCRTEAEIEKDRNNSHPEPLVDFEDIDPLKEKIKSNMTEIRAKYEEYLYNPFDVEIEERDEFLNSVKDLFIANLFDELELYEEDPKNTEHAVHVTNSEPQYKSKIWDEARLSKATASDIKEFTTSLVGARAVCKKKLIDPKDISHVPAIKWGNVKSSSHINNQMWDKFLVVYE